ncbi:DUF3035 domain-containing protein [Candidatus Pelagibacter sp.]|jgi:PBP1b-binding outer membrane lipoprotein LpoB|nr:DUF3035 domain-containing protein [Candidatus Pelagibacter sp.]
MKKIKTFVALFLSVIFLNACSTIAEGLSGSKKKGSEEFLINKKPALVLPPNFGELPAPQTNDNGASVDSDFNIEEIINQSSTVDINIESSKSSSSIEQSIIEKIKKKKIRELILEEVPEEIINEPKNENFLQKLKKKISIK